MEEAAILEVRVSQYMVLKASFEQDVYTEP